MNYVSTIVRSLAEIVFASAPVHECLDPAGAPGLRNLVTDRDASARQREHHESPRRPRTP
jgi:hypothetical protein